MELRQYLFILRRHKWFVVEVVLVFAILAAVVSSLRTPVFSGTAQVLLKPNDTSEQLNPGNGSGGWVDPDRYVAAQKDIITSVSVAREALKFLPGLAITDVEGRIVVSQAESTDVVGITATATDAERASEVANAVAKGYIENRRLTAVAGLARAADDITAKLGPLQDRIAELDGDIGKGTTSSGTSGAPQRPLNSPAEAPTAPAGPSPPARDRGGSGAITGEALKATRYAAAVQYETLFARQQELLVDMSLKQGSAELIAAARTPSLPDSPRPKRDAALAGFVGLLLGVGITFLREQLDDRVRSADEIERITGLPILARLPYDTEASELGDWLAAVERPSGALSEATRSLRTSIQYLGVDNKAVKTLIVTSATPGEGKTTVAANLAVVYAQADFRTVLVSADLRRPRLENLFGPLSHSAGLGGVIAHLSNKSAPTANGEGPMSPMQGSLLKTLVPNLWLMPAGPPPPNPAELLASASMAAVLNKLSALADVVIIDTPPVVAVTDATVLASRVDGVVLVTAVDETGRAAAQQATRTLRASGARLLGTVINKDPQSANRYGYNGYYGTSNGNDEPNKRGGAVRRLRKRRGPNDAPLVGTPSDLGVSAPANPAKRPRPVKQSRADKASAASE